MSLFRSLGRDLLTYGVMGGLSRSVHLLLLPVLARQFSTSEYGTVDMVAMVTSVLTLLMAVSLQSAVARSWFEAGRENEQKHLVSTILAFVLVFGSLVAATVWQLAGWFADLLLHDVSSAPYIVLGVFAALLTALNHIPQMVLRMQRRILLYTVVTLLQTVSFASLALLLILQFDTGVIGVFVAQVLAGCLSLVVGLLAVSEHIGFRFAIRWLKSSLAFSLPLFPAVVVSKINRSLDRVLLVSFLGLGAVGLFGAAARIAMIISLLVDVFRQAWVPLAIAQIDGGGERNEFYRRALNYFAGSMTGIALVIAAYSPELMGLLVPVEYQAGYAVIPWLVGAQILHGSAQFTNLGMLISKKMFGNSKAAWTGVAVNITLAVFLIPRFGIWGAAIGSFVGSLVFTSLLYRSSMAVADVRLDLGKLCGILGCYVASCIGFIAAYEFVSGPAQSLALRSLLLGITLWAVFYLSVDAPALGALRSLQSSLRSW